MHDMLVIGAGPAGMAAAITARQFGLDVLVIEKRPMDQEKICGDGLTKKSISALLSLGITPDMLRKAGANEIRSSIHIFPEKRLSISHEADSCFTLQRGRLMALLREKAEALGVSIQYNTAYKMEMSADCMIDASGCRGNRPRTGNPCPVGLSAVIRADTKLRLDTLYFVHHKENDNGYCWAFPLSNRLWNTGIWHQKNADRLKTSFDYFEKTYLNAYLENIEYIRGLGGALLGTTGGVPPLAPNAVQCGDAAGLCDAVSGEGISSALRSGIAAATRLLNTAREQEKPEYCGEVEE